MLPEFLNLTQEKAQYIMSDKRTERYKQEVRNQYRYSSREWLKKYKDSPSFNQEKRIFIEGCRHPTFKKCFITTKNFIDCEVLSTNFEPFPRDAWDTSILNYLDELNIFPTLIIYLSQAKMFIVVDEQKKERLVSFSNQEFHLEALSVGLRKWKLTGVKK